MGDNPLSYELTFGIESDSSPYSLKDHPPYCPRTLSQKVLGVRRYIEKNPNFTSVRDNIKIELDPNRHSKMSLHFCDF